MALRKAPSRLEYWVQECRLLLIFHSEQNLPSDQPYVGNFLLQKHLLAPSEA